MKQRFIGFIAVILTIAVAVIFGQNDASTGGCCATFTSVKDMMLCEFGKCYTNSTNCKGVITDPFAFCYDAMFNISPNNIPEPDCCKQYLKDAVEQCEQLCGLGADPKDCCECLQDNQSANLFISCLQCSIEDSVCPNRDGTVTCRPDLTCCQPA